MSSTAAGAPPRSRLIFMVPLTAIEACKAAIFAVGAGKYPGSGNYSECCFTTIGIGQFRPGDTANPHLGSVGKLEEAQEARVETLCVGEDVARNAIQALRKAHPYEEPEYHVLRMENFE